VLLVALVGIVVTGVFGLGVAKRLSPYGDTDPSTQSVQAANRYQAATRRQIDPGVVALVETGGVHTAAAERRVRQVEAELRSSRDVAAVSSYYDNATRPWSPATGAPRMSSRTSSRRRT
jgi:hypothetical protein